MQIKYISSVFKQRGATLFTSLMMLLLMTVISIAATKMSIIDIFVAGNDQQQMLIYQATENRLTEFTHTNKLSVPLSQKSSGAEFGNVTGKNMVYKFTGSPPGIKELITDLPEQYACVRQGVGTSLGGGAPVCDLYDFQVIRNSPDNTGVKDQHHRGAGKMVPNPKSKGSIL